MRHMGNIYVENLWDVYVSAYLIFITDCEGHIEAVLSSHGQCGQ